MRRLGEVRPPQALVVRRVPALRSIVVPLLLAGVVALGLVWLAGPEPGVAFADPVGPRTTSAMCASVVIDDSSSMAGSDPEGIRGSAVSALAQFLDDFGLADDRVGVVWFADSVAVTDPIDVARSESLPVSPPPVGGGTVIAPAVEAAARSLESCGSRRRVVVLVTDGQSDPDDLAGVESVVGSLPAGSHVHLIAMNGGGVFQGVAPFWERRELGLASVRPIDSFGSNAMSSAMAHVLSLETGQDISPA